MDPSVVRGLDYYQDTILRLWMDDQTNKGLNQLFAVVAVMMV